MADTTPSSMQASIAHTVRQRMVAQVAMLLPPLEAACREALSVSLINARSLPEATQIRDAISSLTRYFDAWPRQVKLKLQALLPVHDQAGAALGAHQHASGQPLALLEVDAMEMHLAASKLAASVQQLLEQEWQHLRMRLLFAQGRVDLLPQDVAQPAQLSLVLIQQWLYVGFTLEDWRVLQPVLHAYLAEHLQQVYREANRYLIEQGVLPEIHLRDHVIKASESSSHAETRLMAMPDVPQSADQPKSNGFELWVKARQHAHDVASRLKNMLSDRLGDAPLVPLTPALAQALQNSTLNESTRLVQGDSGQQVMHVSHQLQRNADQFKTVASNPFEKATIEVVALMFQSILNEERIVPTLRVNFAKLQIPVLRVALSEPEFLNSTQHPARQLIDRIGACALGFEETALDAHLQALETEVRRVVQVIEQYPEGGAKVFQVMHAEFQQFLTHHLQSQGGASKLVSVAQQLEQRETLSVQFTIELRKQINQMPVPTPIRDFLFRTWSDVLAMATVKLGAKHEQVTTLKQVTTDLIWAASAKPSRPERAQLILLLPKIMAHLRTGMNLLSITKKEQDAAIKTITHVLIEAFQSRTEIIPGAQLRALTRHLSNLEDLVQDDTGDLELDQHHLELITGIDAANMELITEGGVPPSDASRAWAFELQLGTWMLLRHKGQTLHVQLAWRSQRGQLCMFVASQQHCMLIAVARMAAYLESRSLVPAEQEALTVRATRQALEQLDADPLRLLH